MAGARGESSLPARRAMRMSEPIGEQEANVPIRHSPFATRVFTLNPRESGRIRIASVDPFGPDVVVLAHEHHVGLLAVLAELLRGVNGEQHRLVFALVGAELLVIELDHP